jgi:SAM-dependent methyltransferase
VSACDPETLAFYAAEAPVYVNSRPDDPNSDLVSFLDILTPGASILELGCGGGRDAAYMIKRGFEVLPTDGVLAMAQQAEVHLGRTVRVMQFDELCAVDQFDAVVAVASLLHAPFDGLPAILRRIWRALKPGGIHIATYKSGGSEGRDKHGRYYNYPSSEGLERAYRLAGAWSSLEIEEFMGVGYFSEACPWLKIIVRKDMMA